MTKLDTFTKKINENIETYSPGIISINDYSDDLISDSDHDCNSNKVGDILVAFENLESRGKLAYILSRPA